MFEASVDCSWSSLLYRRVCLLSHTNSYSLFHGLFPASPGLLVHVDELRSPSRTTHPCCLVPDASPRIWVVFWGWQNDRNVQPHGNYSAPRAYHPHNFVPSACMSSGVALEKYVELCAKLIITCRLQYNNSRITTCKCITNSCKQLACHRFSSINEWVLFWWQR